MLFQSKSVYSAPSYGGGGSDFDDFLNALAAFLPIALFLAAIPPNLVVVNNRKKREINDSTHPTYPFVRRINEIGLSRFYRDWECQQKIFCEMASYQQSYIGEANAVQKTLRAMVTM